jgi:[protein-PII] uridylyltransferase
MAAVGPGVLNDWKQRLLADLYRATERVLTGDTGQSSRDGEGRRRRQEVRAAVKSGDAAWWDAQIAQLPTAYLFGAPPAEIVAELEKLRVMPHRDAVAWGRFLADRQVVEYTVGTYEEITPGIFHKLTGALTSKRQSILTAEIHTLGEGLVLDRFYVEDADFAGPPPEGRLEEISRALVAALKDNADKPPVFRKVWQERTRTKSPVLDQQPTHVTYDNGSSERHTILSVFAYDRMGLLYAITRTLFEVGLSVTVAKISTRLDQVADVFYVVDSQSGQKITDEDRLATVCGRLLQEIEALAKAE